MAMRVFEDYEARRERVPLYIGLAGPSGGGKTYSALRLATGIQRVTGGDIWLVDTEARRGLHYADRFRYRHVPFAPPFGPLDYLAAVRHCVKKGARTVIVDSMSHEHEGEGGVLEMHESEMKRLAELWKTSEKAADMAAWGPPKRMRTQMVQGFLQLPVTLILCFRAKNKIKVPPKGSKNKDPIPLGYTPIAGEELLFEMTLNCLLLPRADGVPTWQSEEIGERAAMKLPAQFRDVFAASNPLSEEIGEQLARWAQGEGEDPKVLALLDEIALAEGAAVEDLAGRLKQMTEARQFRRDDALRLSAAMKKRREVLAAEAAAATALVQEEPGAMG